MNGSFYRVIQLMTLLICGIAAANAVWAASLIWDDAPRRVMEYRVQPDGSVAMRVDVPVTSSGCTNNNILYTDTTAPAYRAISSLGFAAFASQKTVLLIYSGCSPGTASVNLVGLVVLQ